MCAAGLLGLCTAKTVHVSILQCSVCCCKKSPHHTHNGQTMAAVTEVMPMIKNMVRENPGDLLSLPCSEKAANSTAVSKGHSSLKIQTQ